jgi:ribosomal protein S3
LNKIKKILYIGWKIGCFGRFKRQGRAKKVWYNFGSRGVPLSTYIAEVDYTQSHVKLKNGICCIKIFLVHKFKFEYII